MFTGFVAIFIFPTVKDGSLTYPQQPHKYSLRAFIFTQNIVSYSTLSFKSVVSVTGIHQSLLTKSEIGYTISHTNPISDIH